MGKLFKIFGNYAQQDDTLDSVFIGEVVIDDEGVFRGYYHGSHPHECSSSDDEWFVIGIMTKHGDKDGAAFYAIPNDDVTRKPTTTLILDLEDPFKSRWSAMNSLGQFIMQGDAEIHLSERPYSVADEARIMSLFNRLNEDNSHYYLASQLELQKPG